MLLEGKSDAVSLIPFVPSNLDRAVGLRLMVGSFAIGLDDAARLAAAVEAGGTFRVEWAPAEGARVETPRLVAGMLTREGLVRELRAAIARLTAIEVDRATERARRDARAASGK